MTPREVAKDTMAALRDAVADWGFPRSEERDYWKLQLHYVIEKIRALKKADTAAKDFESARKKYAAAMQAVEDVIELVPTEGYGDVDDFYDAQGYLDDSSDIEQWIAEVEALRWRQRLYEALAPMIEREVRK